MRNMGGFLPASPESTHLGRSLPAGSPLPAGHTAGHAAGHRSFPQGFHWFMAPQVSDIKQTLPQPSKAKKSLSCLLSGFLCEGQNLKSFIL